MRVVIQRVSRASVTINNIVRSSIKNGLLVLAGIEDADNGEDILWISNKIANLRIFNDENGVMNLSVKEVGAIFCWLASLPCMPLPKRKPPLVYQGQ